MAGRGRGRRSAAARAPSSAASTRTRHGGFYLRDVSRKPPADVVRDASRRGSVHDVCSSLVDAGDADAAWWTSWTWTTRTRSSAGWERGHMAYGAVWLRVRTLSVLFLWRWQRRCWGLADWWNNWIVWLTTHKKNQIFFSFFFIMQARGLGYVHIERVWTRAFASLALASASASSALDTSSARVVDYGRRVRPGGVRALTQRSAD